MRSGLLIAVLSAAFLGLANPVSIVENGRCDWTIVYGSAERDKLAATDFQEIFEKATGISLELRVKSEECRACRCFLVGAEFAGKELADEQTWVAAKDGNIVLADGALAVNTRGGFGHHPHGLDPDKTRPIVDFFVR